MDQPPLHIERHRFDSVASLNAFLRAYRHRAMRVVNIETITSGYLVWLELR